MCDVILGLDVRKGDANMIDPSAILMHLLVVGINFSTQDILDVHAEREYIPCATRSRHFAMDGRSPCYDCVSFSWDLVKILGARNISAVPLAVWSGKRSRHMIVGYNVGGWRFVEPQTGMEFKKKYHLSWVDHKDYEMRKEVSAAWQKLNGSSSNS